MRILVDIGHPAHVHFYKYAIKRWHEDGHLVMITVREKDLVIDLLNHYGLSYLTLTKGSSNIFGLPREYILREWKLLRVIKDFKPDVITAIGGIFITLVGKIAGVPTVVFTDNDHVKLDRYLTLPLATSIYSPEWYLGSIGPNHHRYRGFQELAYLHPDYFEPNPAVLEDLGLSPDDRFSLLRFISWKAAHDIGQSGFSSTQKIRLVKELSREVKVLISVEGKIPEEMKPYQITTKPEQVHDVLYYASLYVGEGATMATEAGLLGTPAVYVSSLVGSMGNFIELERLRLVETYQDGEIGIWRALEIINNPTDSDNQKELTTKLYNDFEDVTELISRIVVDQGSSR